MQYKKKIFQFTTRFSAYIYSIHDFFPVFSVRHQEFFQPLKGKLLGLSDNFLAILKIPFNVFLAQSLTAAATILRTQPKTRKRDASSFSKLSANYFGAEKEILPASSPRTCFSIVTDFGWYLRPNPQKAKKDTLYEYVPCLGRRHFLANYLK